MSFFCLLPCLGCSLLFSLIFDTTRVLSLHVLYGLGGGLNLFLGS